MQAVSPPPHSLPQSQHSSMLDRLASQRTGLDEYRNNRASIDGLQEENDQNRLTNCEFIVPSIFIEETTLRAIYSER